MSFKMPTGKKLDSMLDKLSAKDIKEIRAQFELDVQKENQKETDMPNKETMSSIYEAIADMSDHHLKVASSYEELEKILDERNMKMNRKWSEQGIEPGWVVQLKFVDEAEALDTDTDSYIIAKNTNYALVSLTDGEVIATADSVDYLKSVAEKTCDSSIELVDAWPNTYDWGIEL